MDAEALKASLAGDAPPAGLNRFGEALWHAGKGNWDDAHNLVQSESGREAAWIHAHLHRVEGDHGNAGYWYRQAGKPVPTAPLEAEWQELCRALLGES